MCPWFTWSTRRPGPSLSARAPRPPPAGCSPRRQLQQPSENIVTSQRLSILTAHLQRGREPCTCRARVKAPGQRTRHPRQCPGSAPRERRETGGSCRYQTRGCWKTCWTSQYVRTIFYVNRKQKQTNNKLIYLTSEHRIDQNEVDLTKVSRAP